ncbi:MAG: hypothetical protein AB7O60_07395 [Variibacter sp.]
MDDWQFARVPAFRADAQALPHPERLLYDSETDPFTIGGIAQGLFAQYGYDVRHPLSHIRLFTHDFSHHALVVLHNQSEHDAELLVFASPGVRWTLTTARGLARWMFLQQGLQRVTLRLRASDATARDYALRLGFRHEGIIRAAFKDGEDCSLWGMLRRECRLLKGAHSGH